MSVVSGSSVSDLIATPMFGHGQEHIATAAQSSQCRRKKSSVLLQRTTLGRPPIMTRH
jgi:hypothetical protein